MKGFLLIALGLCPLAAFAGDSLAPLEPLDREIMRPPPFPRKWETNLARLTAVAEKGDSGAQFDLGAHYIFAVGTTQSFALAVHWLTKSADQNFPPAQYTLGVIKKYGFGISSNRVTAAQWFRKAADLGYAPAKHEAAVEADRNGKRAEALKLLREAAEKGFPSSEYLMGCIASDPVESYMWHSLAVEGGLESAGTRALELRQTLSIKQLAEAVERIRKFKRKRSAETPHAP